MSPLVVLRRMLDPAVRTSLEAWARHCKYPDVEAATCVLISALVGITEHPGHPGFFPDEEGGEVAHDPADIDFLAPLLA